MPAIDTFIEEKVLPEYRDIVHAFRTLMQQHYPDVHEAMRGGTERYYGVPVYKLRKTLITLSPTKKGITFNFSEGGRFEDRYGLLEGAGTKTLNVRIQSLEQFDEQQMRYYIDQAIRFDA